MVLLNFGQRTPRPSTGVYWEKTCIGLILNDKTPVIERYQVPVTNLLAQSWLLVWPQQALTLTENELKEVHGFYSAHDSTILSVAIGVSLECYRSASVSVADRFLSGVASILLVCCYGNLDCFGSEINARAGHSYFLRNRSFWWRYRKLLHVAHWLPPALFFNHCSYYRSSVGYHLSQPYLLDEMHADYVHAYRFRARASLVEGNS